MPEITFDDRVKGLRGWARTYDANIRAAVELLAWHESWLRRADFLEACVAQYGPGLIARINWIEAEWFASVTRGSSSERAILELAVALADREYGWLRFTGDAHAKAVVTAIAAAMGVSAP